MAVATPSIPDVETKTAVSDQNQSSSTGEVSSNTAPPDVFSFVASFEQLDKWKRCERDVGSRFVFEHNKSRAENTGFPSIMSVGKHDGLTEHEVAAVFGWTTGDYRLVNPIARGQEETEFEDYPETGTKVLCKLGRADVRPYIHMITAALAKLPALPLKQRLYRGHRRSVVSAPGNLICLSGFASFAYDRDTSMSFIVKPIQGNSFQRTLLVVHECINGRNLARLSARRREGEVLFPVDSCFEVIAAPDDTSADDLAASEAQTSLQAEMPTAEVRVVHLRQISPPEGAQLEITVL